ncbi:hypothetical protein NHX12_034196 [Muraenolepis orangiensis]|uniref:Uncharacterized protein n=1 Tax=Muraenolepis orangiensis TaxID=630683 RepID=A0A9Q0I267_9TELE|nr:hypothetical protein NHX12_034196 [Muraenolepis orangiensis]
MRGRQGEQVRGDVMRGRHGEQENIEKNSLEHKEQMEIQKEEQTRHLEEKEEEIEVVRKQLTDVEKMRDENGDIIEKLKQEIKDTVEGQRILEKKGSAALKDLKRQLQSERKRADKLQERLQDILTNSKTRTGLEELRSADLSDEEVGELFHRLALVQQEKWMLEEKVKHLEVSCSSMAEDVCRKSVIIETYVQGSRTGAHGWSHGERGGGLGERGGGLGAVLRDLVKPGDENLRDMNKKLQNMLEEQLTKNMHLQKDLEVLSQELVCLSKDGRA